MRTLAWGEGGPQNACRGGGVEALRAHGRRTLEFAHVVQVDQLASCIFGPSSILHRSKCSDNFYPLVLFDSAKPRFIEQEKTTFHKRGTCKSGSLGGGSVAKCVRT